MRPSLLAAGLVAGLLLPAYATAGPSLLPRGVWVGGQIYAPGSVVQHDGRTWIARQDAVAAGVAPGTNDSWVPLTEPSTVVGARGPFGPLGPIGIPGPFGLVGPVGGVGPQGATGQAGALGPTGPAGAPGAAASGAPTSGRTLRLDRRGRATVPVKGLGRRSIVVLQATAGGARVRVAPVVTGVRTGRFTVRGTPRSSFRYAVVG
ncbi:hypothetical protein [Patulibacter sp.]|uniref:hypothetical protein n=1 Tax=Patulibacter sp. TaxID=1912859 RepID=UPI002721436C|nr:hypothetical protein [Patulibacter sp.]MDO9408877.1 hypothetical protein [Patulibacter sp.]